MSNDRTPPRLRDLPLVYIAGPYTKPDPCENTHKAIQIANRISDVCAPLIPHLSHFWHTVTPHPYEFWTDLDLAYLQRCDAILRFEGESPGADAETASAATWNIPTFHSEHALREWLAHPTTTHRHGYTQHNASTTPDATAGATVSDGATRA